MKIFFDIGNSRIKWLLRQGSETLDGAIEYDKNLLADSVAPELEKISKLVNGQTSLFVASVIGDVSESELSRLAYEIFQQRPVFARVQRDCLNLLNEYIDLEQLGVDRWLAVLAGWVEYKGSVLIVNCGTALTIDAVQIQENTDPDGPESARYMGGLILPGVDLMTKLLNEQTAGIFYDRESVSTVQNFARSTSDCIYSAAISSMALLIEDRYQALQDQCSDEVRCYITGGASAAIQQQLKLDTYKEPRLVLHGLEYWSEQI